MVQFYREASQAQIRQMEALLDADRFKEALELLESVTGTKLHRMATQRVARRFMAAAKDDSPLTDEERRALPRANMWVMDWEMDGLELPKDVQKVVNLKRQPRPSETRILLEWFWNKAPRNY